MIERLLIGLLAHGLSEETTNETEIFLYNETGEWNARVYYDFQSPSKFHVGMLSISLIVGLGYGGFVTYSCWAEENIFLSYCRNLVIALFCKTFFTLVFDAVAFLGNSVDVGGANTLSAFESLSHNLVIAFWLLITVYIHARMQRNFNNEPSLKLFQFGVPGVAAYFSMVWIFAMEGDFKNFLWWFVQFTAPCTQWITGSLRLLYLLVQLGLLFDVAKMTMNKSSLDNDCISLLRKLSILMGVLVFLFWLHFGLSVGRPSWKDPNPYFYFYYLIDGLFCAAVCPIVFFMDRWVSPVLGTVSHVLTTDGERRGNVEVCVDGPGSSIVTVGSVMTRENEPWSTRPAADVVYSSVVHPDKLKNTFDLYKRLNATPVLVGGERFYDCGFVESRTPAPTDARLQKKNAFYSSKYLIVEPKNEEFPRYLETRGSVSLEDAERPPRDASAGAFVEESGRVEEKRPQVPRRNINKEHKKNSETEGKRAEADGQEEEI